MGFINKVNLVFLNILKIKTIIKNLKKLIRVIINFKSKGFLNLGHYVIKHWKCTINNWPALGRLVKIRTSPINIIEKVFLKL